MKPTSLKLSAALLSAAFFGATISCQAPKKTVAATPETTTEQASAISIPYEKFVLDNGLEVILHEDHSDPIVAVATIMHVGSNREKPGKTGFAHFFEHMAFNDSENAPVGANRKLIPEWGGERNGGTWSDGTIYYEVVPKDAFDKILWIDSDRLGYMIKTVTEDALAREIQVVKNEKRQSVDNTAYGFTDEIIRKNLYPTDHPYHWTVIGQLPDLQAATLEDVKEFYEQYYGAGNATLVIAGDINKAEAKEKVQRWFGEIRKGPEVKPLAPKPVTLEKVKSLYFEDNFAKLPELRMVFPTVENYHPDIYALEVLGQLLSGNKETPLYKIIVEEKKQAPGVMSYQAGSELAGQFVIRVRANANTSLNDVNASVEEGMKRFETNGFSDQELERIRAGIETQLYAGLETVLSKARTLGIDNEFKGDPAYTAKAAKLSQAVTREDVMRVYHKYLKNKPSVMTSVVPKGQTSLIVKGAEPAQVFQEQIVAGVQNEEVGQGKAAEFEKTPSKFDRSEPPFSETPLFKMPAIWTSNLQNGLKVYGIENNEVPLVAFDITIPGGHALDPIQKAGVASLMADMLKQGTATKTAAELEAAIDLLGASISVTATNEEIRLQGRSLARNFEPTLALAQEILLQPRWDVTEYDRLKRTLETNLKGREANPTAIASINFNKLLYGPDHILGYPVNGTLETTSRITLDDLKAFYNANISPTGAAVHVAGAVDQQRVTKALAGLETAWAAKPVKLPTYALPKQKTGGQVYFIDVPDAKQSVLYIGRLAASAKDPQHTRLNFANEILGGGSSGRLFQTLRIEKGYTYGAYSYLPKNQEVSPFIVSTSVRANATLPSLQLIRTMLTDYGPNYSEKEVETAKNKILKSNTLAYESLNDKLGMLREISKFGKSTKFIEEDQQALMNMNLNDFKTLINTHLKEKDMVYVVVGDKATQLPEVKKFAGGKVTVLDGSGKLEN